jgi:hypothetical protein
VAQFLEGFIMTEFFIGMIFLMIVLVIILFKFKKGGSAKGTKIFSSIEQLRAIGELSAYKVMTKEIVTETDHTWGEFGTRYLSWVLSKKKMAMIFEFAIDFRYDLQSSQFNIEPKGESAYLITMPPCDYEVNIRDIRFYDEQRSKLLPWLLPDLLNGLFTGGFSEEDKNRLVDAAKKHAEQKAIELIHKIQSDVQKSAQTTLESISRAFGVESIEFQFLSDSTTELDVEVSEKIALSA